MCTTASSYGWNTHHTIAFFRGGGGGEVGKTKLWRLFSQQLAYETVLKATKCFVENEGQPGAVGFMALVLLVWAHTGML